ncbi:hypothetical protein [Pseudomonas helvetica]|uniref:hypothetical protein n=1 Tax=Pseudomonas helvetica TaxID=3136738 RepID=UPI003264D423
MSALVSRKVASSAEPDFTGRAVGVMVAFKAFLLVSAFGDQQAFFARFVLDQEWADVLFENRPLRVGDKHVVVPGSPFPTTATVMPTAYKQRH